MPFEYHRNSAVCFADSTASMHRNARHLPLYLTFGLGTSDQVWREHAEDLYAVMAPFADTVVIRESAYSGHGWGCAEEGRICDFLGSFVLDRAPRRISVQADEEGRWYWADVRMRAPAESFARLEVLARPELRRLDVAMIRNVARAELDLPAVGFPLDQGSFTCGWSILDGSPAELSLLGLVAAPSLVLRDGALFANWTYDPGRLRLTLDGEGTGLYAVVSDLSGVRWDGAAGSAEPALELRPCAGGSVLARLGEAGMLRWGFYDATGRTVFAAAPQWHAPGVARLRPSEVPASGVYFVRATLSGERRISRSVVKLVVVR